MSIEWIIGLAATIVCALVGAIYMAGQGRDDKQDARFDRNEEAFKEHGKEDSAIHERVVRLETDMATVKGEVKALRDMRHEIIEHTTRAISEWYASVIEQLGKRYAELVVMIERLRK